MTRIQKALDALLFRVAMGEDFSASLYAVSKKFRVNPNRLGYEFDAINNNQW